uniref:Uncharacterized protein n=1 Tax=Glossina palpalis gambiensis TaxID=67801 RepID=A0A1B0C1I9_9MUSC
MDVGQQDIDFEEVPVEIIHCGGVPVEEEEQMSTEYEEFLGFTDTDSIVSPKKVAGKQTDGQTDRKFSIESPNIINLNYNVIDDEGPSTLAVAAGRRKDRRLEPDGQEVEKAERVVPDIEPLQEVVRKSTPRDKIVQLHFDEVFTDYRSAYCTYEDRLYGCGYAEEIGLDVRAVVCNRNSQNRKTLKNSVSSVFYRQREDGSKRPPAKLSATLRSSPHRNVRIAACQSLKSKHTPPPPFSKMRYFRRPKDVSTPA